MRIGLGVVVMRSYQGDIQSSAVLVFEYCSISAVLSEPTLKNEQGRQQLVKKLRLCYAERSYGTLRY